ncbi:hypothetical protein D3C81_890440 [compost metagenome]
MIQPGHHAALLINRNEQRKFRLAAGQRLQAPRQLGELLHRGDIPPEIDHAAYMVTLHQRLNVFVRHQAMKSANKQLPDLLL